MQSDLLVTWVEIKKLVELIDLDVHKNANDNIAAGVRVRRTMRVIRKKITYLMRYSLERDRSIRKTRKEKMKEKRALEKKTEE